MALWIQYVAVDDPEGPRKYVLDRHDDGTWVTVRESDGKPKLGTLEVGALRWGKLTGVVLSEIKLMILGAEGGMKSRKFTGRKQTYTRADIIGAPHATKRGKSTGAK